MLRPLAVAVTLASLVAAPSVAKDSEPYYRAELSQALADNHVIAGGVLWMCDGTACVAGKGTGRPVVMCKRLAEAASPVMRFSFGGAVLAADDLARCNG
jgi:hypothetical protein